MSGHDSLGDRIKRYERVFCQTVVPRSPLIIRADGRAFHTVTRICQRPFDVAFTNAMVNAACRTAEEMQGFKIAYVQSDEATFLLTDYDRHETQGWFGYEVNKVVSISAALMSVYFQKRWAPARGVAVFDSRAFTVPESDVANVFLWRAQDWHRNSIEMFARAHFSHRELHGKNQAAMHEMLHGIGRNWATDVPEVSRNGTFLVREQGALTVYTHVQPAYSEIAALVEPLLAVKEPARD